MTVVPAQVHGSKGTGGPANLKSPFSAVLRIGSRTDRGPSTRALRPQQPKVRPDPSIFIFNAENCSEILRIKYAEPMSSIQ